MSGCAVFQWIKRINSWCWYDKKNSFPPIRVLCLLCTSLFYFLDIVFDSLAAQEHLNAYREGDENGLWYFWLTLGFILLPTFVINLLSFGLYTWSFIHHRKKSVSINGVNRMSTTSGPVKCHTIDTVIQLQEEQEEVIINENCETRFSKDQQGDEQWINIDCNQVVTCEGVEESNPNANDEIVKQETMSLSDDDEEVDGVEFYPFFDHFSIREYISVLALHVFQLGFLFRVIRLLYLRSKKNRDMYSFDRYRDISFLRLMEAFLESAPQLLIQLYIVSLEDITDPTRKSFTIITVIISMVSLAMAIADYSSACKDVLYYNPPPVRDRKPRLTWTAYMLIIIWHLFMIVSRAIAVVLFATELGLYVLLAVLVHYLVMLYWLRGNSFIVNNTDYEDGSLPSCRRTCCNLVVKLIAAAFNFFFPFKIAHTNTGSKSGFIISYYTLFFYENLLLITLWYVHVDYSLNLWYLQPAPVAVTLCFIFGLSVMVVYYHFCHPNDKPNLPKNPCIVHPLSSIHHVL